MPRSALLAIAAKEFSENVHSRRFQIALVLATLLMVTSIVTLAITHQEDADAHQTSLADMGDERDISSFSAVASEIAKVLRSPNPLSVFVGGPGDEFRRSGTVGDIDTGPATNGGSSSPTNQRFDPLDLGFVSVAIMTFMAVLFAYDAISGERERGTLKLLLTNPVPKDTVLFGKYLGGMASVLLPFGISLVVGLAVFQFMGIALSPDEWVRLVLIILLFVPLASAFYLLGLLVSSVAKRSSTSLLALLLVWLVLVFGAGNVAAVAAKSTYDGETDADLLQTFAAIRDDEQSRTQALQNQLFPLFQRGGPNGTSPEDQAEIDRLQGEMQDVFEESQDRRDAALDAARRQLDGQLRTAESIALLSPAEAYRSLATALARSDYWSFKHDREAADLYLAEVERERSEWQRENGILGTGGFVIAFGPGDGGARPIQDFEPPAFEHRAQGISEQLGSAQGLWGLAVLLGYNLVSFLGAYLVFLRYDVR